MRTTPSLPLPLWICIVMITLSGDATTHDTTSLTHPSAQEISCGGLAWSLPLTRVLTGAVLLTRLAFGCSKHRAVFAHHLPDEFHVSNCSTFACTLYRVPCMSPCFKTIMGCCCLTLLQAPPSPHLPLTSPPPHLTSLSSK